MKILPWILLGIAVTGVVVYAVLTKPKAVAAQDNGATPPLGVQVKPA